MSERIQMNIRLSVELYHKLREISQREERTISQTVRYALTAYVANAENNSTNLWGRLRERG